MWRRAAAEGAVIGAGGAAAFLIIHAPLVEPIWRAIPTAAVLGPIMGAIAGVLYERLQDEPRFQHPLGGMLFGALAGLTLWPFAIAGWMRSRGAPDPFWILILALLVTSLYHALQGVQERPGRLRRLELMAGLIALNGLPVYFLTFISNFHDEAPDPYPMVIAVGAIYVAAGVALTLARRRRKAAAV